MDPSVARILDVNANRAREAFRVIEDFARLRLDDAALCERIKSLRHGLADALGPELGVTLIRARDIAGDVGRDVEAATEYARSDAAEVATAAGRRAGEALRTLEEYAKTFDPARSRKIEQLRYTLYELERALTIRTAARQRLGGVRLYVIVTESLCAGPWFDTARQAIRGGADCLQLREKSLPDGMLLERCRRLADLCREEGALFVVNDRPDLAVLCRADGVHVGEDDLPPDSARRIVGPERFVGVSTHSLGQAREAMAASPDYLAVGPMFATPTKPRDHVPGPPLLRGVQAETSLPIVPIGGINGETLDAVLEAGADRICVCRAVIGARDPAGATRALRDRIEAALGRGGADREDADAI